MALKERLVGYGPSLDRLHRWWNFLWKLNIPPKIKLFIWKVFHNAFSSSENLLKQGISIDPRCKLCSHNFESSFHVFFHCTFARDVWKRIGFWKSIRAAVNRNVHEMLIHLFLSFPKN